MLPTTIKVTTEPKTTAGTCASQHIHILWTETHDNIEFFSMFVQIIHTLHSIERASGLLLCANALLTRLCEPFAHLPHQKISPRGG
jgi:hypothetical protein